MSRSNQLFGSQAQQQLILNKLHNEVKALFTRVRYRTVPLRSVQKSGTERGCVHTGMEKIKRSVPKQVQKLGGTEK